jgi:hypothetical protein
MFNRVTYPSKLVYILCKLINAIRYRFKKIVQLIRYISYIPKFNQIGDEIILDADIYFNKPHNITIGDGTFIGQNVVLNAVEEISFGENCAIAAGSYFMTWNHVIEDRTVELRQPVIERLARSSPYLEPTTPRPPNPVSQQSFASSRISPVGTNKSVTSNKRTRYK